MTYKDLRDRLNTLTEEQLAQTVRVYRRVPDEAPWSHKCAEMTILDSPLVYWDGGQYLGTEILTYKDGDIVADKGAVVILNTEQ